MLSNPMSLSCRERKTWSRFSCQTAADSRTPLPRLVTLSTATAEGARIERWTHRSDGDVHWRSISRDNILTLYGKDANSRIVDPDDGTRIFTWLICETRDDKGNAVLYEYKREDGAGVDLTHAHERNRGDRDDPHRKTNRYLKRIRYGNRVPLLDNTGQRPRVLTAVQIQNAGWMFEVVFDYGEHDADAPTPDDAGLWTTGFKVWPNLLCDS